MLLIAFKMLIGNRSACLGAIFGIFLTSLLVSQQSAIFLGILSRSCRLVNEFSSPNIWVMDPSTESDDKVRLLPEQYVSVIRSIPGIQWAVPISRSIMPLVTDGGKFDFCELYGIDDSSLIGAPKEIIHGDVKGLHRERGVLVDLRAAEGIFAKTLPDGRKESLMVGDSFEINGQRAVVVGICKVVQGFYPRPLIYTTFSNYRLFNPSMQRSIGFIAAKTMAHGDIQEILRRIELQSGLLALTQEQFKARIIDFFLSTGILINFGLSVTLGVIIGFSIAGQIFYNMTMDNIMYYALMKALGATQRSISQMILLQALIIAFIGFSLGVGSALLWGSAIKNTTLAFLFPWQLLCGTATIILIICILSAGLSIRKVFLVDAKTLMGN